MPNWAWWVIAAILFGAEMFVVDAQFYLVFFGVAAAVVGVVVWLGVLPAEMWQWMLFALLSIIAMVGFRKRLYEKLRRPADGMPDAVVVGSRVQLPQSLAPGQSCRVEYRGSTWTARNVDQHELSGEVVIAQVDGLTLLVRQVA